MRRFTSAAKIIVQFLNGKQPAVHMNKHMDNRQSCAAIIATCKRHYDNSSFRTSKSKSDRICKTTIAILK